MALFGKYGKLAQQKGYTVNNYQKDEAKASLEAKKKELATKIAKTHSPSGQRHSFDRINHNK